MDMGVVSEPATMLLKSKDAQGAAGIKSIYVNHLHCRSRNALPGFVPPLGRKIGTRMNTQGPPTIRGRLRVGTVTRSQRTGGHPWDDVESAENAVDLTASMHNLLATGVA